MRLSVLALLVMAQGVVAGEFALRDGDRVVFLGDSITAARIYGKIIENYTLLRFPDRNIRFYNAGWGGDTAAGGLKRLERDVFPLKPTALFVAYGTNDIGWGVLADEEHKQLYLRSIRGIIEACQKRKVRVFLCSAAIVGGDPARGEESFLQKMCDEGMAIAREMGEQAVDVQRGMREIQKKVWAFNERAKEGQKKTLFAADGVHLNEVGQLAMAYTILKGIGAPAEVSSAHLDAKTPGIVAASKCKVTDLAVKDGGLSFTRLDEGLPFNNGLFYPLNYLFVPVPSQLNQYLLRVESLDEGKYEVKADGRGVGKFTAKQLSKGVNIASTTTSAWAPGGPWDAQATVLKELTDARHNLATAEVMARALLKESPLPGELTPGVVQTDDQLAAMQRQTVRPRPYHFVLRKVEEPSAPGKGKPKK